MSERILILGLPGSGTSAVCEVLSRAGYADAPPTFARGEYAFDTHESLLGRAVNRLIVGVGEHWPTWRWHHDFRPRNPYNDPEVHHLARLFVDTQDAQHERWYFKNPESLMAIGTVWNHFDWSDILLIYRHPEESIRTLHSLQNACYRRSVWNRYMRTGAQHATATIRFPDDLPAFAESFGVEDPYDPSIRRTWVGYPPNGESWCSRTWKALEAKRWATTPVSTSATAT